MNAVIEKIDGIAIISLHFDTLDASNSKEFKQEMLSMIEQENAVILDLNELTFVDSSGLGAILSCLRNLHDKKGDMKLCNVSNQVRVLFELVRMHRIFDIYNTREEAVDSFRS